jgi:WD40 repeat protein
LAIVQRGEARDQARATALARAATVAASLPADQIDVALLLGVETRRLDRSDGRGGALEAALAHVPLGVERLIHVPGGLGYANVSPNGRRFVTAGMDGKARIVALPSGRVVRTLDLPAGVGVGTASFSPDGRLVVVSSIFEDSGTIRLFDARTGRTLGPKLRTGAGISLGQFPLHDSSRLVTVNAKKLIRWDVSDPTRPVRVGAPIPLPENLSAQPFTLFAISPDGRTAATSAASIANFGPGGSTYVWDLESGARRLGPVDGRPTSFTSEGTQLILRRANQIAFVDAVTGADRSVLDLGFAAGTGLLMSPDGRRVAVSSAVDAAVRVFDLATSQPIGQALASFTNGAYPLAFLPEDRLLVGSPSRATAAVWHYLDATPLFARLLPGHTGDVDPQFTVDGSQIVTRGADDHRLLQFRARDGQSLGPILDAGAPPSSAIALSPDASTIAAADADGTVSLWDRRTEERLSVLATGQVGEIHVTWSPAGPVLATVSQDDRAIALWDVSDPRHPRLRHRVTGGKKVAYPFRYPVFSPDGRVVAVNDYPTLGRVTFVGVARGRKIRTIRLGPQVGGVVYSRDGEAIVTIVYPIRELTLLDAATGKTLATRRLARWPQGWGFIHGGRRITTQSVPNMDSRSGPSTVEFWDATTLEPYGAPIEITGNSAAVGWTNPGGTKLVTGSSDGYAVLWDVSPRHWKQRACNIARRNLTRAEWMRYLPDYEYHRTCRS